MHGASVILPVKGRTYPFPKPNEEQVIVFGTQKIIFDDVENRQ